MSSENNNVWQLPESEAKSLAGEENPMYINETGEDKPFPKRWKSSSSFPQTATQFQVPHSHYNPLNEPSPLGLRLRKSPSLLELAQKRLNEVNSVKGDLPDDDDGEARTKRDSKARSRARARVSSSLDKLKASHFPALLLRIGQWEYVSKHEGDLVAKCYFSKHKIVWEVLDGGLKKKFEINWADIIGLKANFAPDGPGSLTFVLDKQPLFYKEINPQPRKHTQWRATSDFTNGEASTHRQHVLQCAQGVLDKHYEKLIECDTRLYFLSQQQDTVLNFPPKPSIKDISGNNDSFNLPEIYNIIHMGSPSNIQNSSKTVETSSLSLFHQDMSKEAHSSSSGMSMDIDGQKDIVSTVSISDVVNVSKQNISGNLPLSNNTPGQYNPKNMLQDISEILLSDNQLTAASDERTLMSKVNSFCSLLHYQNSQQHGNDHSTPGPNLIPQQERNDSSTPGSILTLGNTTQEDGSDSICLSTKLPRDYPNDGSTPGSSQMAQQDENDNSNPENEKSGISRNDSFADLVHQLPRIASLPRFLFEISENGEILK